MNLAKIIFTIVFSLLLQRANAQIKLQSANEQINETELPPKPVEKPKPEFGTLVDKKPLFKEDMYKFLAHNIHYPIEARDKGIQGRVIVNFIIDTSGNISDITVVKGIGGGCDEEAKRVISLMSKWTPAIQDGKPVSFKYTMPILFSIEGKPLRK